MELEIIDIHLHPPQPITLSESYDAWNSNFVSAMTPDYDFDGKDRLKATLSEDFKRHLFSMPRQIGYFNYMARTYGVAPTIEVFDNVVKEHLGDFSAYITSILDREKIPVVVLQSRDPKPVPPSSHIPSDRFIWTYPISNLIQPDWAKDRGAESIRDVVDEIDQAIDLCVANKCAGLKNDLAYYRPLSIQKVEKSRAEKALKSLLQNEPSGYASFPSKIPKYKDTNLDQSLQLYQDYLTKQLYVKAGEAALPVFIHTAVALHPGLSFENNNPLGLYEVFQDDDVQRASTQFILLHTGFPYHHLVASMISQFPNVFVDVSFYSKFPGILEETLRTFLSLAPSEKVMHGSDSNNVPEEIGYCASNTRRVLAKILNEFESYYGWTGKDCERIARNVMSENARRVFKIDR